MKPPTHIEVAWCRTCDSIANADVQRVKTTCPMCPPGKGKLRYVSYVTLDLAKQVARNAFRRATKEI